MAVHESMPYGIMRGVASATEARHEQSKPFQWNLHFNVLDRAIRKEWFSRWVFCSLESFIVLCSSLIAVASRLVPRGSLDQQCTIAISLMTGMLIATTAVGALIAVAFQSASQRRGFERLIVQSTAGAVVGLQYLAGLDVAISIAEGRQLSMAIVLVVFIASVGTNVAFLNVDGPMPVAAALKGLTEFKLTANSAAAGLYVLAFARAATTIALASIVPHASDGSTFLLACGAAFFVAQNLIAAGLVGAHLLSLNSIRPFSNNELGVQILLVILVTVEATATDAAVLAYIAGMNAHEAFVWCACLSAATRFVGGLGRSLHRVHVRQRAVAAESAAKAQEAMRASLLREERDRLALFRYVNHEYRGPLNAIVLGIDLLRDRQQQVGDDVSAALLADISHEADSLDHLLLALHEFSVVEQGRFAPEPSSVDVCSAVSAIMNDIAGTVAGVQVDISVSCDRGSQLVYGQWLERVLCVFVQNAVRFSRHRSDAAIHVRVWDAWETDTGPITFMEDGVPLQGVGMLVGSPDESRVATAPRIHLGRPMDTADTSFRKTKLLGVSVTDNGKGVDAGDMYSLFRPFEQLRLGGDSNPSGSGLSLAIVRALTLRFAGCVGAISERELCTVFYAMVPTPAEQCSIPQTDGVPLVPIPLVHAVGGVSHADKNTHRIRQSAAQTKSGPSEVNFEPTLLAHTSSQATAEGSSSSDASSSCILVVDDSVSSRKMLARLLRVKAPQFAIDEAVDGQAAVNMVTSQRPGRYSLIFMDNDMPIVKGVEATATLRARGVQSRIVMVTGTVTLADRKSFISAGADAILAKPVRAQQLLEQLELV